MNNSFHMINNTIVELIIEWALKEDGKHYDVEEKRLSRGSIERVEASLARARLAIREASTSGNRSSAFSDPDYVPFGTPYRNAHVFHR